MKFQKILRTLRSAVSTKSAVFLQRMEGNPQYRQFKIGQNSYGSPEILFASSGQTLVIGSYVSIADDVTIALGGEHRTDWISTFPLNIRYPSLAHITGHPLSRGDVVIGNDVWIGRGVLILSGVTIGDGAVIGAGAVVRKAVEPYEVVVGNPAEHVRYRFSKEDRETLCKLQWWNWPEGHVLEAGHILMSGNIQNLLYYARKNGLYPCN